MAEDIYLQMQKLANQTQIKLQDMSDKATAKSFKYNTKEAKASRDWQTQMSNTSHQREVKDLVKAGLNPVLAANQGAQSYTTSSASAEAENPASAVASMYASQMSGMAGVKESEISAAATRHAAATSAAAQRAAAAQAAAAQKYAADMAYRTSQERNEAVLEKARIEGNYKLQVIDKTPPQNVWEFTWKMADQSGIRDESLKSKFCSGIRNSFYMALNDPRKLFINTGKAVTDSSYYLSTEGYKTVVRCLTDLKIRNTPYARDMLIKGVVFHKPTPLKVIANLFKMHNYGYYKHY